MKKLFNNRVTMTLAVFLGLLGLAAVPAFAGSVACPQALSDPNGSLSGSSNAAYQNDVTVLGQDACNIIITFNGDGSVGTTLGAKDPYDGVEDQLVGIVNNSPNTIFSISLTNPGITIFGFDGDGICVYQPFITTPGGSCNGGSTSAVDPQDYLGTASSFSSISSGLDSGNVNWANGIAAGSTGYFSLEEPASLTLQVGPGVPEPASVSLIGLGLCGLYFVRRRAKRA